MYGNRVTYHPPWNTASSNLLDGSLSGNLFFHCCSRHLIDIISSNTDTIPVQLLHEGSQALSLLNELYPNISKLLFGFWHCQLSMSKDVFVDKNDDVVTCIGIHSIASVEAWSCFP